MLNERLMHSPKPRRMNNHRAVLHHRHLYLTVLAGGATTLAVELSASRLLGPFFGTSTVVWAGIIGLILIYLAAGYFIGGHWADRAPTSVRFYQIVAWGAFASGITPFGARFLLPVMASSGLPLGLATPLSLLVLFMVPVTLLGCIPPFAVRLALATRDQTGRVAGQIYAVSTLGSVGGALVPVLYLLPEVGTTTTFLLFADVLLLMALLGLILYDRRQFIRLLWMPAIHILLWASQLVAGLPAPL